MNTAVSLDNMSSFEYNMFLIETSIEEYKLELVINESLILASSNKVNDLKIVHESFKNKMKNAFDKLINLIKTLWGKFVETMTSLISTDQKYLEKYKSTILKANFNGFEYMMYPYHRGMKYLEESKVPAFNYSALRDSLESEEKFKEKYFKTFIKDGVDFNDRVRQLMRGSDKELKISATELSPELLYNYCHDFPKLMDKIKKDMKEVENAGNNAITKIANIKTTAPANESAIYSFLHESMIVSEIKRVDSTDPNSYDSEKGRMSKTVKNVDGDHTTDGVEDNVKNIADDLDRIKLYIRVCYNFLGIKMSVAQEMYKAFMYIIRDYIKSTIGKKDNNKSSSNINQNNKSSNDSNNNKSTAKGWVDDVINKSKNKAKEIKDKVTKKKQTQNDNKEPDTK